VSVGEAQSRAAQVSTTAFPVRIDFLSGIHCRE
jgi:hypothetical protein